MLLRWCDKHLKYLFTIPTLVFVIGMIGYPLVYTTALSFSEWSMSSVTPMRFVGLANYITIFKSERFLLAALRTFSFSAVALFFETVMGVAIALFVSRNYAGKSFVKTMYMLPMVATPVAVGLVWTLIYEPTIGIANRIVKLLGFQPLVWLGSADTALVSLMIVDIWQWTPMVMLIILAGIAGLPSEPYESAMVDGASKSQMLWKITIPLLSPTILIAMLLRLIDVLKTFDIIYSTTQGGPGFATETMNILSFRNAFEYFRFGEASATLVVFFIIVMTLAVIFLKIKKRLEVDF